MSSGNLKTDIKKALEKNMSGELDLDGYAESLSDSIKNFLTRQEFRIVKLESEIDVEHIRTTESIPVDVSPDTLFGPYGPVISMFKKIAGIVGAGSIIDPLESKLKAAAQKVSEGGSSMPKLDIKEGGQGGDVDVKGVSTIDTNYKGKKSSNGLASKSVVVLFEDEISDTEK